MPGIGINLLDRQRRAEIGEQPAAIPAIIKKEILVRLIRLARQLAVVQFFQAAAVPILFPAHNRPLGGRGGIGPGRCRYVFEFEFRPGIVAVIASHGYFYLRLGRESRQQQRGREDDFDFHKFSFWKERFG